MPKVIVHVLADTNSLERGLKNAGASLRGFSLGFGQLAKGIIVVDAVQKAIEGLTGSIHLGIEEFSDAVKIQAQTQAALKSTGSAANVTNKQIDDLALSLSNLSGIDDEVVKSGENMLLSFTHIRNQVGKNNDIFTRATKDVLDFSIRTGRDMPAAAVLLGKALENPASKIASLARAGVIFTAQQIKQVKAMQMAGNVLGAQRIILAKLEERYKGAAEAAGKTLPGQLHILKDRFKDLAGSIVGFVAPSVSRFTVALTDVVKKISETKGIRAKLDVAWVGLEDAGKSLFAGIRSAVESVDWSALAASAQSGIRSLWGRLTAFWQTEYDTFLAAARSVDWNALGASIVAGAATAGDQVAPAVVGIFDKMRAAIRAVDWNAVGKAAIDGLALVVVAIGDFLVHVDWVSLFKSWVNLQVTALKATGSILYGAGKELGRLLVKGIGDGLASLAKWLEEKLLQMLRAVLKAIPASGWLPGLSDAIDAIDGKLKKLQATAVDTANALAGIAAKPAGSTNRSAAVPESATKDAAKALTLDTTQGLGPTGGLIPAKPKKDTGEPKWKKAFDAAVARLGLAVGRAGLTAQINDDIAATQQLITYLQRQVSLHKTDLTIQQQLVDAQKSMLSLRQQEVDAIKNAALAQLDKKQQQADTSRAVRDAKASLATAKMIGGPVGIRLANEALADAMRAQQRVQIENSSFRLNAPTGGGGQTLTVGNVTIHIHSNQSPEQIATEVLKVLQKRGKHGSTQQRGTIAGRNFNVGIN